MEKGEKVDDRGGCERVNWKGEQNMWRRIDLEKWRIWRMIRKRGKGKRENKRGGERRVSIGWERKRKWRKGL